MTLFGGITLPGEPDLENVRKLDYLLFDTATAYKHNTTDVKTDTKIRHRQNLENW